MNKLLERFYLISKLSTVFLLLFVIFFMVYLFWKSYQNINTSNNKTLFDENLEIIQLPQRGFNHSFDILLKLLNSDNDTK